MANNVYFNITNENGRSLDVIKTASQTRDYGTGPIEFLEPIDLCNQPFMFEAKRGEDVDSDGWPKDSYTWHCEEVGAKWCNIEEWGDDAIGGYSAWSPPIPMLGHLAKYVHTDLRMTYEDEFRNFIGVAWADTEGLTSYEEIEGEDLMDKFLELIGKDELPEDFDWSDNVEVVDEDITISADELMDDIVYNWFENQ